MTSAPARACAALSSLPQSYIPDEDLIVKGRPYFALVFILRGDAVVCITREERSESPKSPPAAATPASYLMFEPWDDDISQEASPATLTPTGSEGAPSPKLPFRWPSQPGHTLLPSPLIGYRGGRPLIHRAHSFSRAASQRAAPDSCLSPLSHSAYPILTAADDRRGHAGGGGRDRDRDSSPGGRRPPRPGEPGTRRPSLRARDDMSIDEVVAVASPRPLRRHSFFAACRETSAEREPSPFPAPPPSERERRFHQPTSRFESRVSSSGSCSTRRHSALGVLQHPKSSNHSSRRSSFDATKLFQGVLKEQSTVSSASIIKELGLLGKGSSERPGAALHRSSSEEDEDDSILRSPAIIRDLGLMNKMGRRERASDLYQRSTTNDDEGAEATEADGGREICVFRQGTWFGEDCLLHPGSIARVTVRARSDGCNTCRLLADDFKDLIQAFPTFYMHVEQRDRLVQAAQTRFSLCAFLALGTELFEDAEDDIIEAVGEALSPIVCAPRQQLIAKGTASAGLFIVRSGECHCLIPDPEDATQLKQVATKLPGQHFGELSLLEPGTPTAAHVVAGEHAEVLLLTPSNYEAISREHAKVKGLLLSRMPSYKEYNLFFHMPLFSAATHDFLYALVKATKRRTYESGEVVQSLSDVGGGGFFIERGQVSRCRPASDARPRATRSHVPAPASASCPRATRFHVLAPASDARSRCRCIGTRLSFHRSCSRPRLSASR